MTVANMLAAVRGALPGALSVNFTAATDPWDIFEAYTFAKVLEAARSDGYQIDYRGVRAGPPPQFVFRRGPGSIWSPRFSYAVLSYGAAEPLEVHVGIGIEGQSGVAHEADVSVLREGEAEIARRERFAPRARGCVFGFECKYYATRLDLSILREYLGLTTDLRSHHVQHWIVSNVSHPELPMMLKHHNRLWADAVVPGSPGERNLEQQIEPALHRYRR
jgi:hypothetical protein